MSPLNLVGVILVGAGVLFLAARRMGWLGAGGLPGRGPEFRGGTYVAGTLLPVPSRAAEVGIRIGDEAVHLSRGGRLVRSIPVGTIRHLAVEDLAQLEDRIKRGMVLADQEALSAALLNRKAKGWSKVGYRRVLVLEWHETGGAVGKMALLYAGSQRREVAMWQVHDTLQEYRRRA